jgi:hypothetical protein
VLRVTEIVGLKNGKYGARDLFRFEQTGVTQGKATGTFHATGTVPRFLTKLKASGIDLPVELFAERPLEVAPSSPAASPPDMVYDIPLNQGNVPRSRKEGDE